jgi:ATP-dependent DNA ligase
MALEALLLRQDVMLPVRRLSDDGQKAWQEVLGHGWEGLVAKNPMAPYLGGRTLKWLKVKQPKYREGERGWEPRK